MDKNYSILQTELKKVAASETPLHMPGHKRRIFPCPDLPYSWDTTETPATDDLHAAQGILASAMARTAALWGAGQSWYLVNGSTVGLLAGIRALAPSGGAVIAARNCHRAVCHAIELNGLAVRWIDPPQEKTFGVSGSVTPAQVALAIADCPRAKCVIVTSPTYAGVLSDIGGIAGVCHAHGIPLLVDEAHGAHLLPLAARYGFGGGALQGGADVVVQSAHKTLPSLTQTALLHCGKASLAHAAEIERQLDVFETSSPSYVLLVSLDACTGWLQSEGEGAYAAWRKNLNRFDAAIAGLTHIKALCHGRDAQRAHPALWGYDRGKILLDIGWQGAAFLRARGLEPEWVHGGNVLAYTTLCDDPNTFEKLATALLEFDALLKG